MKAYKRGYTRGQYLKRLERKGVIGAAVNPYKKPGHRAQWQQGFMDSYYGAAHD